MIWKPLDFRCSIDDLFFHVFIGAKQNSGCECGLYICSTLAQRASSMGTLAEVAPQGYGEMGTSGGKASRWMIGCKVLLLWVQWCLSFQSTKNERISRMWFSWISRWIRTSPVGFFKIDWGFNILVTCLLRLGTLKIKQLRLCPIQKLIISEEMSCFNVFAIERCDMSKYYRSKKMTTVHHGILKVSNGGSLICVDTPLWLGSLGRENPDTDDWGLWKMASLQGAGWWNFWKVLNAPGKVMLDIWRCVDGQLTAEWKWILQCYDYNVMITIWYNMNM